MFLIIWYDICRFILGSFILVRHAAYYIDLLIGASVYSAFISPLHDQSVCGIDKWGIIIWHVQDAYFTSEFLFKFKFKFISHLMNDLLCSHPKMKSRYCHQIMYGTTTPLLLHVSFLGLNKWKIKWQLGIITIRLHCECHVVSERNRGWMAGLEINM